MLRIAVAQTPGTTLHDWHATHESIENLILRAAREKADLALLPECVWPAYFIDSVDNYFVQREAGLPGPDDFLNRLSELARANRISICAGFIAEKEQTLLNAVALFDSAGELLGIRHKCFLWDFDHDYFQPGSEIQPVESPWGPIGLMICADARLPEIPATLVARGARLILQPTAWVNVATPPELWNPQPALLIPERAREFNLPIASASKWGTEGNTPFVGSSLICAPNGQILAQCGTSKTELIVAEVSLETPRLPQLTPAQRERLLSLEPSVPVSNQVPPLQLLAAHPNRRSQKTKLSSPTLLLTHDPSAQPSADRDRLYLSGPSDQYHTLHEIRLATATDADANHFAPIRAQALNGAHLIVVFGENVSTTTIRARAAENRLFIIHCLKYGLSAYNPHGEVVGTLRYNETPGTDEALPYKTLTLDVAQSANKEFAPRTNPFTNRHPQSYEF